MYSIRVSGKLTAWRDLPASHSRDPGKLHRHRWLVNSLLKKTALRLMKTVSHSAGYVSMRYIIIFTMLSPATVAV